MLLGALFVTSLPTAAAPAIELPAHRVLLEFHSAFLMNLHAFLLDASTRKRELSSYTWIASPTPAEAKTLTRAIAFYQTNYAQRNLLDDPTMSDIKKALSVKDTRQDPNGLSLPPALTAILDSVSPIYLRCLWPAQDRSNREWIRQVKMLNAQYGAEVQADIEYFMIHRFQITPIRVDIVVATGSRNGGYTDTQTILPSGRTDYQGLQALEMLYHEATHIDVADTVTEEIDAELKAKHRSGDSLWHAVQFYTVGEIVKGVYNRKGNIDYQTYADLNGVYTRGSWPAYHAAIEAEWRPYLQGHATMRQAISGMVAKMPPSVPDGH
ncbi:MAG TPA: hypothetical protein VIY68_06310 [Steroidobacteraceae bacterium]